MCYGDEARPPLPPVRFVGGAAADHGDLTLKAADGNSLMAYGARASKPTGAGMVVMPDVRGLHHFYKELAQRFAEAGIDAVAIDYYGRTAGEGSRDESFEWRPYLEKTSFEEVAADVAAGIAYLRSKEGGAVRSVFTVGFCYGGAMSWRQSAANPELKGVIGFYGVPQRARDVIPQMKAPLLLLIAGADHTPQEEFARFQEELKEARVPHEAHVYEGAPHSFFDRTYAQWQDAGADAWKRIIDFVSKHKS